MSSVRPRPGETVLGAARQAPPLRAHLQRVWASPACSCNRRRALGVLQSPWANRSEIPISSQTEESTWRGDTHAALRRTWTARCASSSAARSRAARAAKAEKSRAASRRSRSVFPRRAAKASGYPRDPWAVRRRPRARAPPSKPRARESAAARNPEPAAFISIGSLRGLTPAPRISLREFPQRGEHFVRPFAHQHVAGAFQRNDARVGQGGGELSAGLGGGHEIALAEHERRRHRHLGGGRKPVPIGVAGEQILEQTAR